MAMAFSTMRWSVMSDIATPLACFSLICRTNSSAYALPVCRMMWLGLLRRTSPNLSASTLTMRQSCSAKASPRWLQEDVQRAASQSQSSADSVDPPTRIRRPDPFQSVARPPFLRLSFLSPFLMQYAMTPRITMNILEATSPVKKRGSSMANDISSQAVPQIRCSVTWKRLVMLSNRGCTLKCSPWAAKRSWSAKSLVSQLNILMSPSSTRLRLSSQTLSK
mmetsp:Transcript_145253/g.368600  ORF Transcript_145253/g.368600 Transcript_145253/m.368600 type:complete len:221 (+) Transcript_145253:148-810(+)